MRKLRPVEIEDGSLERILGAAFAPVVTISELIKNASDACYKFNDTIVVSIDSEARTVKIKDNGYGISESGIEDLRRPGRSTKMKSDNLLSRIGEPYAGSKGLGILTAFSLCSSLEVITYSMEDKRTYKLFWKNGSAEIEVSEVDQIFSGTELILHGINNEHIRLLTDADELRKLFISTINYYKPSATLPAIEFFLNGENITVLPDIRIDALYEKHNKKPHKGGFFVAKASFRYSKNKLYLAYEDNEKNAFTFEEEIIDLTRIDSLKQFIFSHNIEFRRLKEIWEGYDKSTQLDEFEGCYYIWRDRRSDVLDEYPYGVRVYVNNYGLYRYLNGDDGWLQHSEISQSVKNTNYKLRNTYGYISFRNYSEDDGFLKISNDRNDFIVNLAQKKFKYIMRHFVSGLFSYIDIAMRDYCPDSVQLKARYDRRNIILGQKVDVADLIISTVSTSHISIDVDSDVVFNEDNMTIHANSTGLHTIKFTYKNITISVELDVKDPTPRFALKQSSLKSPEGTSVDLSQYIKKSSIVGISISDIEISSNEVSIKKNYLAPDTHPGEYVINYTYTDADYEIVNPLHLTVTPLRLKESKKIIDLFPTCQNLTRYYKIKDVIVDIAESYTLHPTLCMIAIRTLIEASFKAFEEEVFNTTVENSSKYDIEQKWKWIKLEVEKGNALIHPSILSKYQVKICANHKSTIMYYKELEPNAYIHRNDTIASANEVYTAVKRFSLWLNFIIDSLIIKQNEKIEM